VNNDLCVCSIYCCIHNLRSDFCIQLHDNVSLMIYLIIGQVFLLHPPMNLSEGDDLKVSFVMSRSKGNHRLMEVELGCEIHQHSGKLLAPFKNKYYIE